MTNKRDLLLKTIEAHKEAFKDDLSFPELHQFLQGALNYKRNEWLKGRLFDHPIPAMVELIEALDELQDERMEAAAQDGPKEE